jgi:hypothetical protein
MNNFWIWTKFKINKFQIWTTFEFESILKFKRQKKEKSALQNKRTKQHNRKPKNRKNHTCLVAANRRSLKNQKKNKKNKKPI